MTQTCLSAERHKFLGKLGHLHYSKCKLHINCDNWKHHIVPSRACLMFRPLIYFRYIGICKVINFIFWSQACDSLLPCSNKHVDFSVFVPNSEVHAAARSSLCRVIPLLLTIDVTSDLKMTSILNIFMMRTAGCDDRNILNLPFIRLVLRNTLCQVCLHSYQVWKSVLYIVDLYHTLFLISLKLLAWIWCDHCGSHELKFSVFPSCHFPHCYLTKSRSLIQVLLTKGGKPHNTSCGGFGSVAMYDNHSELTSKVNWKSFNGRKNGKLMNELGI